MACLEMFNADQHQISLCNMSPRISFSNDFIDNTQQAQIKYEQQRRDVSLNVPTAAASNFEFSVSNHNMMTADELFSKGRLLPAAYKVQDNNCTGSSSTNQFQKMTLRDELLVDEEDNGFTLSPRPPKTPIRWKEILGLKSRPTTHISSSKKPAADHHHNYKMSRNEGSMERAVVAEENETMPIQGDDQKEEEHATKISSEEVRNC